MKALATAARLSLAALAAATLLASTSAKQNTPPPLGAWNSSPPAAQAMDPAAATGLWSTTFGAVKTDVDGPGRIHGTWMYENQGREVYGYFGGTLDGNVLRFAWREPATPQPGEPVLTGEGWLMFDPGGGHFSGRWWSAGHDRQGDWSGSRAGNLGAVAPAPSAGMGGALYGGSLYGGAVYGTSNPF
ncbi:MAG: hypothetical protein R3B06_32955 [Kofleriaceae bacterium]